MRIHLFLALLVCSLLVCAVQATTLEITVQDDDDGTAIDGASIYIDGDYEAKTDSDGEYSFSHSFDDSFELEVRKSGYVDWTDWIDEDDTSVDVDLILDTTSVEIVIYDADTLRPVDDARVRVTVTGSDDTDTERTSSDGSATFDLVKDEEYTFEIDADDYAPESWEYEIEDETVTLQRWIVHEDRFAFRVLDAAGQEPVDGAEVFIGGSSTGVTGSTGILITHIERSGQVQIRVEADGYRDLTLTRYIDDDDLIMDLPISLATYPVSLIAVDPAGVPVAGAAVFLDGEQEGETDNLGRFSLQDVLEGTYAISMAKDGYVAWEEERLIDQAGQDIAAELLWELAEVSVLVEDQDHKVISGANVAVNGESFGITDAKGMIADSLPPAESYNFTASMEGYTTSWSVIGIAPGDGERSVTITLEKELDLALFGLAGLSMAGIIIVGAGIAMVRRKNLKRRKGF
jgi:hypothetical protein